MIDLIVALILLGIAVGISVFLIREKKKGHGCVGCPHAKGCQSHCSGHCHSAYQE